MAESGEKIPDITVEQVREQLAEETDPKAIKRLTAAREYLEGDSPAEIEAEYGWHTQTIYKWLDRFEERSFQDALYDDKSPGRPPKLDEEQFQQFTETLDAPPEEAGYEKFTWTPSLAQQYLLEEFGVAYSQRHVRRLLHEAGVSWTTLRLQPAKADEQEHEESSDESLFER